LWVYLRWYPGIFLVGLRKTMKSLSQDDWYADILHLIHSSDRIVVNNEKDICSVETMYLNICSVQYISVPGF
jgi:hypothetical protein